MKTKSKKMKKATIHEHLNHFQAGFESERMAKLAEEAMAFARKRMQRRGFRSVIDDVMDFIGIIKEGLRGRFRVPMPEILKVAGALAYLLCPVDGVPDAIPIAGLVDDVAVLAYMANNIADTLKAYREWKGMSG
ncbi:MAG: DUF1232 domain-containing protein [Verrucomicrobiae bacterium]|nr:DUF1232 domain-containing protein [Verrucomicrobiae bacterium]